MDLGPTNGQWSREGQGPNEEIRQNAAFRRSSDRLAVAPILIGKRVRISAIEAMKSRDSRSPLPPLLPYGRSYKGAVPSRRNSSRSASPNRIRRAVDRQYVMPLLNFCARKVGRSFRACEGIDSGNCKHNVCYLVNLRRVDFRR